MTDTATIEALLERLDEWALSSSEFAQRMMEAKSLRQAGNTERRKDLYLWPRPEQTLEGQAASTIRALSAENERLRESLESCEQSILQRVNDESHPSKTWRDGMLSAAVTVRAIEKES